jgi:hypothetical protein
MWVFTRENGKHVTDLRANCSADCRPHQKQVVAPRKHRVDIEKSLYSDFSETFMWSLSARKKEIHKREKVANYESGFLVAKS